MGIFVPEIPVTLPSDARIGSGRVEQAEGVATTRVRGVTLDTDGPTLRRDLRDQLTVGGWSVAGRPPQLTGTRGDQTLVITIEAGREGSQFEIVWTVPTEGE